MGTNLIDLSQARRPAPGDLAGLDAHLAQLFGEPFQFARVSYGDELTLHFGDLRPARSPRLGGKPYGACILGLRGSSWVLKSGAEALVVSAGEVSEPAALGPSLSKQELESGRFVEPGSRVVGALPFTVRPAGGFGLELRLSDGSRLLVLPTPPEPEEPGDDDLPELADWELSTSRGLLSAGPGLEWSFTPAGESSVVDLGARGEGRD